MPVRHGKITGAGRPPLPYVGPVSRPLLFLDVDFTDRG